MEIPMFAPQAQPEGSQTFHVWSESGNQSRSEGAPEILPALRTRGMLDGCARRFTSGYLRVRDFGQN
ncbi:MAG TPA: hypothetical protein VGC66_01410 [Pyrinomonadaceae bacterium]